MQLGNLNLMILKSISESEKYGLEIIDDISKKTNGKTIVKQPSLYSGLRRLEQRGLISSRWEDSDIGGRRHYYAITNLGASELRLHDTENIYDQGQEEVVEQEAPREIPVENVFETKEDVNKQDAQTVSDLENSIEDDSPSLVEEENQNEQFAEFQPGIDNDLNNKSFSDNMKEYVEPDNTYDEYKLSDNVSVEQPEEQNVQQDNVAADSNEQDTVIEYIHSDEKSSDNINYKDILGDLDADLNKSTNSDEVLFDGSTDAGKDEILEEKSESGETVIDRPKSAYQKELEDILLSSKNDDATPNLTIKETDRMAEVNRRYGDGTVSVEADEIVEDETFDENIHRITPKDVGFTYINQEDITVKPYKKTKKSKSTITGEFLNVNKYNFIRASIMFVLMALELALSYVIFNACGLFENLGSTVVILYSVSIAIAVLYYAISLVYTLPNLSKKIKTENINFANDFVYRFIMCAFIIMFILGMNIFMDMPNTVSWLIPCIMAINILISWIVGLIMYKTKNFHA